LEIWKSVFAQSISLQTRKRSEASRKRNARRKTSKFVAASAGVTSDASVPYIAVHAVFAAEMPFKRREPPQIEASWAKANVMLLQSIRYKEHSPNLHTIACVRNTNNIKNSVIFVLQSEHDVAVVFFDSVYKCTDARRIICATASKGEFGSIEKHQ
jgi:hypothetical protein